MAIGIIVALAIACVILFLGLVFAGFGEENAAAIMAIIGLITWVITMLIFAAHTQKGHIG